mmetsp:Transcript_36888/g.37345  ORF Transcript_36888/g.37345 Transcript_36888/m.37345 type:complete len:211 (-) Transcript_36888:193-825(-)
MNSTTDSNINTNINNNYNCTSFRPSLISSSIPATTMMTAQTPTTQTKLNTLYTTCSNNHWSQSTIVDAPGPYDIVCGRNSGAYKNIGNRRFRVTIEMNLQRYIDSPTREEKTNTIKAIVHMLHDDIGARFLKKELVSVETGTTTTTTTNSCQTMLYGELTNTNNSNNNSTNKVPRYTVMTQKQAREKTGHALRDLVTSLRKNEQEDDEEE